MIHKLSLFKQKIQILWRPSFDEQIGWYYNENDINWAKVDELIEKYAAEFPKIKIKNPNNFAKMVHKDSCHYNAYDAMIDYVEQRKVRLEKEKKEKEEKAKKEAEENRVEEEFSWDL